WFLTCWQIRRMEHGHRFARHPDCVRIMQHAHAKKRTALLSCLHIDRFKAYNDTYGHQAGDDALAAVARCIRDNIRRPADSAARYGGEEFVVVLPDTSPVGASQIAEQIRTAISALAIEHAGSEYGRVTASIGAASWLPDQHGEVSAVIRAADEALYNAKATGRNRVWQSHPAGRDRRQSPKSGVAPTSPS
ncbi:GGDEF domain-containing protein, partial [Paraburkholderia terrae]|uniref:GGDEF domain-containing protein n=1 Tax=Paraburkholderia terrae TaxID=311230 RepID=UPI001EE34BFE